MLQLEKQRQREEHQKHLMEERAKVIEKTKNMRVIEPIEDDKPKKGGKVANLLNWFYIVFMSFFYVPRIGF